MKRIMHGEKGRDIFTYDSETNMISDKEGNCIKLYESIDNISDNNLAYYIDIMFHNIYISQNEFKDMCIDDNKKGNSVEWEDWG